ncbi:hypothetical protein BBBGCB_BBBGCB_04195, partial [Dysosmobacter welbionis]
VPHILITDRERTGAENQLRPGQCQDPGDLWKPAVITDHETHRAEIHVEHRVPVTSPEPKALSRPQVG